MQHEKPGGLNDHFFSESFLSVLHAPEAHAEDYQNQQPYPHAVFDNVFQPALLGKVSGEFPDLAERERTEVFDNGNERKLASVGEAQFGPTSLPLMHYLNSLPFLQFLEKLTGVTNLIPDAQFLGGGFHEIKPGGFLKIHADFNRHHYYGLDRRLNVLVYLNDDWKEEFGGHFELWSRDMQHREKKVLPVFNRLVVFSTTSDSYHGHPDPLTCPPDRSRRSLALYYYTNGRPEEEITDAHSTVWRARPGIDATPSLLSSVKAGTRRIAKELTPPIVARLLRRKAA